MAYKVPFIDYSAHYRALETEINATIKDVLSRGELILRSEVQQFEKDMASFLGTEYAVGLSSGTDALILSLRAAGIGPTDEVITPGHTYIASVASVVHCGATPILVDIGEDMNMDVDQVESLITPKTRAIMPVHLNGRLCDMEKLMTIADKHNLMIIEDAAQALGATFDGKKAGSFGLIGCFSFYPAKILGAAGDAGLISTNDQRIAEKIRLLRDHGRATKNDFVCFGFTNRLDNLQAAILSVKVKYVPKWIERRRELASLYHRGLSDLSRLKLPPPPEPKGRFFDVYQNYAIRSKERDELVAHLRKAGIEILVSWPKPLHKQESLGLGHFHLPMTEKISNEVLSLPLYPELSNEKVDFVIDQVHKFYKKE